MLDLDDAVLEVLWQLGLPHVFVEREQFIAGLRQKYDQVLVTPAFVFLAKGPEFHFISLGTKQPMSLKFIKQTLSAFIARHGYACTRTPQDDKRQQRFNERIGFYRTQEDEYDIFYRIDEV